MAVTLIAQSECEGKIDNWHGGRHHVAHGALYDQDDCLSLSKGITIVKYLRRTLIYHNQAA